MNDGVFRIYDNYNEEFFNQEFETEEEARKTIDELCHIREMAGAGYDFEIYQKCDY